MPAVSLRTAAGLVALAGYIAVIFAANWAVQRFGLVPVGFGLNAGGRVLRRPCVHPARLGARRTAAADRRLVPRMPQPAVTRHLLRAKDFIDNHYSERIDTAAMARVAHQSPAHFARQFRRTFGETPHAYLLTRRLERAAALLRNTDYTVARICASVGLSSVGSFTTSFGRVYKTAPMEYRERYLPALTQRVIPTCVLEAIERPRLSRIQEDAAEPAGYDRVSQSSPSGAGNGTTDWLHDPLGSGSG